jgi:hypothetical protein
MGTKGKHRLFKPVKMYLVVNKYDEAFAGLKGGYATWSANWDEAKPLFKESTSKLINEFNAELLEL